MAGQWTDAAPLAVSYIWPMTPELAPEYCLLWINWWPLCMTKAEWSGWVQALGSIAAIMGAFYLARYQYKRGREQALELEKRQLRRRYNAVKGITEDAAKAVRFMVEAWALYRSPEEWRRKGDDLQLQTSEEE